MNVSAKSERRNGLFEWKSESAAVSTGMCLGVLSKSSAGESSGGNLEGLVAQELWVASTGILGGATMRFILPGVGTARTSLSGSFVGTYPGREVLLLVLYDPV